MANSTDSGNAEKQKQDVNQPPSEEEKDLRTLLKSFFYRPLKWKKSDLYICIIYWLVALIQTTKVVLVTFQAHNYGTDRAHFNSDVERGHIAVRHLLLKGWDASWETNLYPQAGNYFAVYTTDSLEEDINFVVGQYYNAERSAIGYYKRLQSDRMQAVVKYFDFPDFHDAGVEKEIVINEKHFTIEHGLSSKQIKNETVYSYSIADELEFLNSSQILTRLLAATIKFTLYSVRPNEESRHALCLQIDGTVTFQDVDNIGQVQVDLTTHTKREKCRTMNISVKDLKLESTSKQISLAVLIFSGLSLVITAATFSFGIYVCCKTKSYMKKNYETDLPWSEYLRFLYHVFWDCYTFFSDIATLIGTYLVFYTEDSVLDVKLLDDYTLWLGLGCILAWMGLLKYFKIHPKLYVLFRTLSRAVLDALAYLACVSVLFIGFWICGYIVLGPYNTKFQTPSSAAETLFALINGDDIYGTIAMFGDNQIDSIGMKAFAYIYMIVYVCTFTIVAINLLVALFLNAYEEIKADRKERKLGPLESAIQDVIRKTDGTRLQPFHDLLNPDGRDSNEEKKLRVELSKIVQIDNNKLVNVKSVSLNGFITDEYGKDG